jgi:hypothetical protein
MLDAAIRTQALTSDQKGVAIIIGILTLHWEDFILLFGLPILRNIYVSPFFPTTDYCYKQC